MMERSDLVKHIARGENDADIPHVVVPLLGQFKGETGEKCHLLMMANVTSSGIEIRKWVNRAVQMFIKEGCTSVGPVMCGMDGKTMLPSQEVDMEFKNQLRQVQLSHPELIEPSVDVYRDFGIFRSMRRGSESRATEQGVCDRVIDLINRWRKMDGSKRGAMAMRDYYLDLVLVKKRMLAYSAAL